MIASALDETAAHGRGDWDEGTDALPLVAVVDDDIFTLEAWQSLVEDAVVAPFPTPSAFWKHAEANPGFLERLSAVVTDYYFDTPGEPDGLAFAAAIKARQGVPVLLSSDAELGDAALDAIDARLPKKPETLVRLLARLPRAG
jgi:hypothetical protein